MSTPPLPSEKGYAVQTPGIWWDQYEPLPELLWPASIDVYDTMRWDDPQMRSTLQAVKLPIRRTDWFVTQLDASKEVTEFVAANLGLPLKGEQESPQVRSIGGINFDEHIELALTCLDFGHSFFEQVYVYNPDDGRAWLQRLGWRPPRTISLISVGLDGELQSITQNGVASGLASAPLDAVIPASSLVAYTNEREGGNWLGKSVMRPAYKLWLLKNRALRIQSDTLERNGMGIPDYVTPPLPDTLDLDAATERQKNEIQVGLDLAKSIRSGRAAGISRPQGSSFSFQGVSGTLPDAESAIRYYDEQISATVLSNFLNLGNGGGTGSYALGETFANFFVMSLQSVALQIANVINRQVVNDLVQLNFGNVPVPKVEFTEIGTQQYPTASSIAQLCLAGALLPDPALENWLRDTLGIPDKTPFVPKQAQTPTPTPPDGADDSSDDSGDSAQSNPPPATTNVARLAHDLSNALEGAGLAPKREVS